MNQAPGIVICAVDFGWGSAGKLSAIIEGLERGGVDCRLIVLGSALGRTVLSPVEVEAWYEEWPRDLADLRSDRKSVV